MDRARRARVRRPWLATAQTALVSGLCWGAGSAAALGVGSPTVHSYLGQPLHLEFPLELTRGESVSLECLKLEAFAGDVRLPASQLKIQLYGKSEATVRSLQVRSLASIQEPVVSVSLSFGCPAKFTRQFSAFMDPPGPGVVATPLLSAQEPELKAYSPALRAALASPDSKLQDLLAETAGNGRVAAAGEASGQTPAIAPKRSRKASSEPKGDARDPSSAGPDGASAGASGLTTESGKAAKRAKRSSHAPAGMSDALSPPARKGPRLQLDAVDAPVLAAAASAVAFDEMRLLKLEQSLGELQHMQSQTRAQIQALRLKQEQDLAGPTSMSPNWAMTALALLSLALAGTSFWFWRRARQATLMAEQAWWSEGAQSADLASAADNPVVSKGAVVKPASPVVAASADAMGPAAALAPHAGAASKDKTEPAVEPAWSVSAPSESTLDLPPLSMAPLSMPATLPMAHDGVVAPRQLEPLSYHWVPEAAPVVETAPALLETAPAQALTVEELIDLEQQVDFFQVLGQDDAAIELLNWQLEGGAGSNALPYLKLLEIHQKRGDEASFQQVASRFSARFGVPTPAWSKDINQGEGLTARPEILSMIESTWSSGADSMALLQDLLTHGDPASMGFDLTSYRELLMLYGVARDLSEQEVPGDQIDVFLPLEGRAEGQPTNMMATMLWDAPKPEAPAALEVDISLDDLAGPASTGKS